MVYIYKYVSAVDRKCIWILLNQTVPRHKNHQAGEALTWVCDLFKLPESGCTVYSLALFSSVVITGLIFLHGLGDTGHGWADVFRELKLNHIRCICPHAPHKPVTLNGGMVMPSWFDIKGLTPNSPEDEEGIKSASKDLQDLIAKEVSEGIPPERIMIGGFSQGGSLALYTALGTDIKVAGLLVLSSWMPLHKQFATGTMPRFNEGLAVLQCHGMIDPMVPFQWGKATSDIIKSFTPNAQFKTYPDLGHNSSRKEMEDVKEFLYLTLKES
ncbi:acyl-protein thioesterase 2 [Elysia marginata]|uniref:palmitoyl-protein hydrolase n=1 Tax=Elysia marginata TaxID=1093978 RepID=A0AAV4JR66_9GAST|nr:acyl-protein thioesterase 2 [Elysia marginata]